MFCWFSCKRRSSGGGIGIRKEFTVSVFQSLNRRLVRSLFFQGLGVKLQKDGASFVSSREEQQRERERDVLVGLWKQQEEKHGNLSEHSPRLIVGGVN